MEYPLSKHFKLSPQQRIFYCSQELIVTLNFISLQFEPIGVELPHDFAIQHHVSLLVIEA